MRTELICGGLVAYFLGAIPFGFLISRAHGVDIRAVGSGNIGATNVYRMVGKKWGIVTLICDILKGFLAAFAVPVLIASLLTIESSLLLKIVCACGAVVGHNWPVFLRFKGGKGIATSAGALLGLAPAALGVGIAIWIITFIACRYVSVASMVAAVGITAASWCFYHADICWLRPIALSILGLLAIWRHRSNIVRLANGTESRIPRKSRKQAIGQDTTNTTSETSA